MMKKNNSGFISAISLLIMAFLLLLTAAVVPRVGAELNFTSINGDGVEAQYAAEAGVKYTAAQILNNTSNTDWSWARGNQELTFAGGETYKITIYPVDSSGKAGSSPIADGVALTSGSKYLIQSVGKVNNYLKTVKVIAHINTGSASAPAIYAGNTATIGNTLKVNNGDVLAANIKITTLPTLDDGKNIYYYNEPIKGTDYPEWMVGNQWYDGPLKNKLKKWSGAEYVYTPDETTVTSLPAFSAAGNISAYTQNYTSYGVLPDPVVVVNNKKVISTTYNLAANTKYYMPSGLPSASNTIYIEKPNNGDVTITLKGNYTTNNSGGTIINLNSTGNFVLNVIGNMTAQSFTINAANASSVTINVTGSLTTTGSGLIINGPANGDVNFNVGTNLNAGQIIKVNGVSSGNVSFTVDGNLAVTGPGILIQRPATGSVNFLVNGQITDTNAGLNILGAGSSTVNIFSGLGINSSGAGIKIDSSTGNVNVYSGGNLTASASGMHISGSSVKVVADGDVSFSGDNSLLGDNTLLYTKGDGNDITTSGSFSIEGSIISADGNINLGSNTTITINDDSGGGTGGSGSGTGTIEFSNWSS